MTRLPTIVLLVPLALLAGCHKSAPKNDQRSASGEVLQGTASDAMIPLGQLSSEPPLLKPSKQPTTPEEAADKGLPEPTDSGTPAPEAGTTSTPAPAPAAPVPTAKPAPAPSATP